MIRSRRLVRILGICVVVGGCVAAWTQQKSNGNDAQGQDFTIRTTSRLVLLDVSVKDSQGGYVSGLTRDNFKVFEDGKPQQISQFADVDAPVTVGLVVDESGSMRPKRRDVITAAIDFVEASNRQDEIFVVNFNEKARRGLPDMLPFTDDINLLRSALWQGLPEGRTALYDALDMSLHQLELGRRDKKTLVVISDGGDNISKQKLPDIMHEILTSLTTVYTIGIFDDDDPEKNPGVLKKLSGVSGGVTYFPKTLEEISPVCKQIAKDIRTRYTIGYIPNSEGKPQRRIKVEASSPEHAKLIVRTRSEYWFTPETPGTTESK